MQYLYRLSTNAFKRLTAFILATILAFTPVMVGTFFIAHLVMWVAGHNFDNPPPLSEAYYLWPVLVTTVMGWIYLSSKIEKQLLKKFNIQKERNYE